MIPEGRKILLRSGEEISAGELFEGLALLAIAEGTLLLSKADHARAFMEVAMDALDWAETKGWV